MPVTHATKPAKQSLEAEIDAIAPKAERGTQSSGGSVKVKVTKFGAGKVSTGEHEAESGDVMAVAGQILTVDKSVGSALEKFGLAEIQ